MPAGPCPDIAGSMPTSPRRRLTLRPRLIGVSLLLLAGACTAPSPAEAAGVGAAELGARPTFVAARPEAGLRIAQNGEEGVPAPAARGRGDENDPGASALSREDVDLLAGVLTDAGTSAERRQQIASRLVGLPDRTGRAAVIASLKDGGGHAVSAILTALEAEPDVDAALVEPLLAVLTGADPPTRARLGRLLAGFGAEAAAPATVMATDAARPLPERLAAIDALASIATRDCGHTLIQLASGPATDVPADAGALRAAASAAFDRMVGRPFTSPTDRQRWWEATSQRDNWWRSVLDHDRDRIAKLEATRDALAARYVQLLRRTYSDRNGAAITEEESERLERLLTDEVREVRRFAIDRVERRLRDGLAIPERLSSLVTARIDDPDPTVRAAATRILDDLADPDLVAAITARLPAEPDDAVAIVMLETLRRRGDAASADAAAVRLDARATEVAAARALIAICDRAGLTEPTRAAVAGIARRRLAELAGPAPAAAPAGSDPRPAPGVDTSASEVRHRLERRLALLELLAATGEEDDVDRLAARLTPAAPEAESLAIARGLAVRGDRGRLRVAAQTVNAVASVLIDALASGSADAQAMEIVLGLRPAASDDPRRAEWERAVERIARGLSSTAVRAIDARLRDGEPPFESVSPEVAISMRRRLLDAAVDVAIDAEPRRLDTAGLTVRLVDVLLGGRDAVAARTMLERLDTAGLAEGTPAEDRLRLDRLAFEVAVRTGHFGQAATKLAAAGVVADPASAWIEVVAAIAGELEADRRADRLEVENVQTALLVTDEIRRRFGDGLPPETKLALDAIAADLEALMALATLPTEPSDPDPPAEDDPDAKVAPADPGAGGDGATAGEPPTR